MRRTALLPAFFLCLALTLQSAAQAPHVVSHPSALTVSVANLAVPDKAREHLENARHAAQKDQEDRFQAEIAKAIAIAPGFAEAYLTRADHENRLGRRMAAVEDALKAQSLDPSTGWACVVLATSYNGMSRYQDAFQVLTNMHGEGESSWQAAYEMARAEVGLGNTENALHWSETAFARAPATFADTRLLLANALQLAHRWREASEQMEAYLASPNALSKHGLMNRQAILLALEHTRVLAAREKPGE